MSTVRRCLVLLLGLVLAPALAAAQEARVALTRDTVNVGDLVGVAVEVRVPAGTTVTTSDTLEISGDLENAARKRVRVDTLPDGGLRYLITYPITVWRPGEHTLPKLNITLQGSTALTQEVTPPVLTVASVLPADTANIQPKPPRDVWGANRLWWPLLLLALLLLLIVGALIWWWRRRKKAQPEEVPQVVPDITPREWVQKELDRIVVARYIERADFRAFYIDLTSVMRTYVNKVDAAWSTDLTTNELGARLGALAPAAAPLLTVLGRADLVKFARHRPVSSEAHGDLDALRQWITMFEKPLPPLAEAA
jgi:hypothetical protein